MQQMNTYTEHRKSTQEKITNLECFFAFSDAQFAEGKAKLGVIDDSELISAGAGMIMRKSKLQDFHDLMTSNSDSLQKLLDTPNGFRDAISYELGSHEYCVTYETDDALNALGLNYNDLTGEQRDILKQECRKASEQC